MSPIIAELEYQTVRLEALNKAIEERLRIRVEGQAEFTRVELASR